MKNHYTLTKMFLATALMANSIASTAQYTIEYLNANNVNAGFGIGGSLFTQFNDTSFTSQFGFCEVPKGSNIRTTYTSGLWLSGYDAGGNLKGAAQRHASLDFYDGPISFNYDSAYDNFYKRVFKITRTQILHHQNLGNVIIPTQIDTSVLYWPAKGNVFVANHYGVTISTHLAPFVDVNNNGIYDPNHGDYPDICSEEAVFFVFNDVRGQHLESHCQSLGIEIRGLAEVFVDYASTGAFEKHPLNNTVFVSYEVENKTANPLFNFYAGQFVDPDLGCWNNDRVGCDTNRNMMFVYNGAVIDPDCQGVKGYGQIKAASGTKWLSENLNTFGYFYLGSGGVIPNSPTCQSYRNYLTALWSDSAAFTEGGTGYGGTTPTKFIFPGDPNNLNDWSEETSGLPAGDRVMFGSTGPFSLRTNEIKHFDFAFITSYDSTATNLTIIDTLKRDADIIQSFYNNSILNCRATHQIPLGMADVNEEGLEVRVYPNPTPVLIFIETGNTIDVLELTDILGRTVIAKSPDAKKLSLDVSMLAQGMYLLRIRAGERTAVKRIVVK